MIADVLSPGPLFGLFIAGLALVVAGYAAQRQPAIRHQLAELLANVKTLTHEVYELQSIRDTLLTQLREQGLELARQREIVKALETQVSQLQRELVVSKQEIATLRQQNTWLQEEVQRSRDKHA